REPPVGQHHRQKRLAEPSSAPPVSHLCICAAQQLQEHLQEALRGLRMVCSHTPWHTWDGHHTHTICMAAPLGGQREAEERHPMYAVTKRGDLPPRYLLRPRLLSLLAAHRRLRVVCSATRAMRVKPLAALGRGALALTVGVAALANLASLLVAHP